MSETVFGRVTKPGQCTWVLALPATKDDFYASQARATSEYTKRFWHWPEYRREFLDDYEPLRELLLSLGVHIVENASIEDFRTAWHREAAATVLFAHWGEDGVEFREGKVASLDVANAIPSTAVATFDLCVCHPQELVFMLEATHPFLIKKAIWKLADPKYWCMFYTALFKHLASHERSYPDALDDITSILLANSAKGAGR
jgi:hypothetical protein